jgi:hypothetical protein
VGLQGWTSTLNFKAGLLSPRAFQIKFNRHRKIPAAMATAIGLLIAGRQAV